MLFIIMTMEKVVRDGKVAVLYSPGFGAGWYSWNTEHPQCLFHPKLVEFVEAKKHDEITDDLMRSILNTDYFYTGGAHDLRIAWLPVGTRFEVDEYDGSESIKTQSGLTLIA